MECNGLLRKAKKEDVMDKLPDGIKRILMSLINVSLAERSAGRAATMTA
jgi:hypothetical protein